MTSDTDERKGTDEARARLSAIVENSNDAIFSHTLDGIITSWNAGAERMLGYTAAEAIGKPATFNLPPGRQPNLARNNEKVLRGEVTAPHESNRMTRDGRVIDVLTSHSPIRDHAGNIAGTSVILQDISARKQAETAMKESEERFRATFEQAAVGMGLRGLDPRQPRWLRVNQKLCDILGYTREELLQLSSVDLTPPEDRQVAIDYIEKLLRGEIASYSREKRYVRKDGQLIWTNITLSVVSGPDGRPTHVIFVIQDISEQKRAEQLVKLEHTVARCLADADSASEALKTVIRALCETENWECGRYFRVDDATGVLRFSEFWSVPNPAIQGAIEDSRGLTYGPGVAMSGMVWQSGQPLWIADITKDARAQTMVFGVDSGIRGAFVFPVKSEGKTIGVFVFNSREVREPDTRLQAAIQVVGSQVGQFLQRKQGEEALLESQRKQGEEALLESQKQLQAITANLPGAVFQFEISATGEYNFSYLSEGILDLAEIRPDDAMRDHTLLFALIEPEYLPAVSASIERARTTLEPWSCEWPIRAQSGLTKWIRGRAVVARRDDGAVLADGILTDVTVEKQVEQEIARLNQSLEQRVNERTRQLEATNKELESFSYSVSHDLRAPLRGIDGFSQLLLKKYVDHLDATGTDYLQRIRHATVRMGALIDDLLQLVRVSRSQIKIKPLDVSRLARSILAVIREREPERKVATEVQDGIELSADSHLLKIVLENLLGNAWKFTGKREDATIRVGVTEQDGEPVVFVTDNGAGFDMKFAHKLFGAFQRLHGPAEFEGTGIGLAMVQRILNLHGGRIWVEAAVGKGATFYFVIPRAMGDEMPTTQAGAAA